jgi:hypothetical protein
LGNKLIAIVFATVVVLLVWLYYMHLLFFGWYDDAIISLFTNPALFNKPFLTAPGSSFAFIHQTLFKIIYAYNSSTGASNGYSILLMIGQVLFLLSAFIIIHQLNNRLGFVRRSPWILGILIILWLPHLLFLNYTWLSILLITNGALLLYHSEKKEWVINTIAITCILLALLLRFQSAALAALLILLATLPLISGKTSLKIVYNPRLHFPLIVLVLITFAFSINNGGEQRSRINVFNAYNFTANDCYLYKPIPAEDELLNLRKEALLSWNVVDTAVATRQVLDSLTYSSPLQLGALSNAGNKLNIFYSTISQYFPSYNLFNLYIPILVFVFMLVTSCFSNLFLVKGQRNWQAVYLSLLFVSLFLFLIVVLKIEFRLFNPLVALYVLLLLSLKEDGLAPIRPWVNNKLIGFFLLLLVRQFYSLCTEIDNRQIEEGYCAMVLDKACDKYENKQIVLDLNSLVMPAMSFNGLYKPKGNNTFITTGEYFTILYDGYREWYSKKCGSINTADVYNYLGSDTNTLFLYNEYKVDFTERYLHELTGKQFKFVPVEEVIIRYPLALFFSRPHEYCYYKLVKE